MKESLLLFIVLTVIVVFVAAIILFSQTPTSAPQVTAGSDVGDPTEGIVSQQMLRAPSGSVVDYTKEESSGTTSGVFGFLKNLF